MKIKAMVCLGLAAGLLAGCESKKGEHSERHYHKEAKLMAEAKVSKDDAEKTALTKVPNGSLKDSEIEKEPGRLIWSFEFTTPDSTNITEVNVDGMTGEVVNVESEKPENDHD